MQPREEARQPAAVPAAPPGSRLGVALAWLAVGLMRVTAALLLASPLLLLAWALL